MQHKIISSEVSNVGRQLKFRELIDQVKKLGLFTQLVIERTGQLMSTVDDFHERLLFHLTENRFKIIKEGILHADIWRTANEEQLQINHVMKGDLEIANYFEYSRGQIICGKKMSIPPGYSQEILNIHFVVAEAI